MKIQHIKVRNDNENVISGGKIFVSALLVSSAVILSMLLFAALVTYTPLDVKYANVLAIVSFYIGSFVSGVISGKNAKNNGWLKGLVAAFVYFLIIFIVSSVLTSDFNISMSRFGRFISALLIGSFGGVLGINLR